MGRGLSDETKLKMSLARKGYKVSDETKLKLSRINKGMPGSFGFKGKKHTEETKRKMSLARLKLPDRYKSEDERIKTSTAVKLAMHRPDTRKRHLAGLKQSGWLRVKMDKGQLELLKKWNGLGFNFEPNYQLHNDDFLCYIDGYDKDKNVVLEYDSKYHQKPSQKKADLIRQNNIIKYLNPKVFWRYDSVSNSFRSVYRQPDNLTTTPDSNLVN